MSQSGYPEAQLEIRKYLPSARRFLVACTRCDAKAEVIEDRILEPLSCPKCDMINVQGEPVTKKQAEKQIKLKLVPATINLPGGVQLFVYLP
jgi:hypothetical protein